MERGRRHTHNEAETEQPTNIASVWSQLLAPKEARADKWVRGLTESTPMTL